MRKMLFLLFFLPVLATAQRGDWDIAFLKNKPDSLTRPIHMPEQDYNPTYRYDEGIGYNQKIRIVVIKADSIYRKIFWRYTYTNDSLAKYKKAGADDWWYNWMKRHHVDSLPTIDFSKNELLVYSSCAQCLAICNHDGGYRPCHRNACSFRELWFIREKRGQDMTKSTQ